MQHSRRAFLDLLQVSLALNIGCVALAVVAALFITTDLAIWNAANYHHLQVLENQTTGP